MACGTASHRMSRKLGRLGEETSLAKDTQGAPERRSKGGGILGRLRGHMIAGILVTAPVAITLYLALLFLGFVDSQVTPLIPSEYNPNTYLPFGIPGLGLVIVLLFLTIIGWLARGIVGRFILQQGEVLLGRMPIIRSVYGAIKQIVETVVSQQSEAFRQVVLFEYPRRGCWAMGFVTGKTQGEVQNVTSDEVVNVFLPTSPNPTSGYLLFVPRRDLVELSMTVEEGIKMVISGGIVTPTDAALAKTQQVKLVTPPDADQSPVSIQDETVVPQRRRK